MFWDLIKLELYKILISKRLILVFVVLIIANGLVVYGEYDNREKFNIWKNSSIERLTKEIDQLEQIPNRFPPQENKLTELKSELELIKEQYYHNRYTNAFQFATGFFEAGPKLYLALLIFLITGDLISSEFARGTIRLVYSSATGRVKYFAAKIFSGVIYVGFLVITSALIALLVGGIGFGFGGWDQPVQGYPGLPGFNNLELLLLQTGLTIIALQVIMLMGVALSALFLNSVVSVVLSSAIVFGTTYAYAAKGFGRLFFKYVFWFHLSLIEHFKEGGLAFVPVLGPGDNYLDYPPVTLGFSATVLLAYAAVFAVVSIVTLVKRQAPA